MNIDGKDYTYSNNDTWEVQVGKGSSAYKTRYSFNNPNQAVFYFSSINIGRGYKKRLILNQNNLKIKIAKSIS